MKTWTVQAGWFSHPFVGFAARHGMPAAEAVRILIRASNQATEEKLSHTG
jgi:hypothetical protein